ncbi:MAG TPA: S-layer homology domain-containing protein [Thermoanaerobaculia bacterium]|nr:S-layer homology domain-containing protein [Thermoanaerobaculia bacterium]
MKPLTLVRVLAAAIGALSASLLVAQSGGSYVLTSSVVAGGGATFETAGPYSLGETSGQSGAGTMSGGSFTLDAGFWTSTACGVAAPAITVPASVAVGATGVSASVPATGGAVYAWSLTGGLITSGQGTSQILFSAGAPGATMTLSVTVTLGACAAGAVPVAVQVDFLDVPPADAFHAYVDTLARDGVTSGCGGGNYCRNNDVTRAQMAVFLLKSEHGSTYAPPPCTGIFPDVECTPTPAFAVDWIEQLEREGVTGGCGGGSYCPGSPVTRAQMAVFLLKTEHGSSYAPPPCSGIFADVACTPTPAFAADWIEQLYHEGVTGGCATEPLRYCPGDSVTRGQMAVFLVKTFLLP